MTKILLGLGAFLLLAQLVPVNLDNPPVEEEIPAPAEVRAILERSCYDCHSNETRWPWYSKVAPISWLVAYDIAEARGHLNFSTWNRYTPKKRNHKLEELREEVGEGKMPLWIYPPLHPEARLSDADKEALRLWSLEVK